MSIMKRYFNGILSSRMNPLAFEYESFVLIYKCLEYNYKLDINKLKISIK